MTAKTKDVIERAVKTFIQAFLALFVPALIAYLNGYTTDLSVKTVIYPALAAGISPSGICSGRRRAWPRKRRISNGRLSI